MSSEPGYWLCWILASSASLSLYDLCKKASVKNNAVFPTLFFSTLSAWGLLTVVLLGSRGLVPALSLPPRHIALLSVKSILVAASWTATYQALKTLPITCAAPIRATGPLWTLIGAILLFAEIPTPLQGLGMLLVLSGCYFFSRQASRDATIEHGKKAVLLAFAGTMLGSCSALYDKYLLQGLGLDTLHVLWWFLGGMCILFAFPARFSCRNFQWRATIPLTGILLAVSDACYFSAIATPDARISVLSLIRRTSLVMTFFIGGAIFRETDIGRKSFALAFILAGVALLCLFA